MRASMSPGVNSVNSPHESALERAKREMSTRPTRARFGGETPVYLSAPVKAFGGGRESLEECATLGAAALLDACGRELPELLLLGSAHPYEFGGLHGDEIAERVMHALAAR